MNELDNRGSHFYLALYWAQALRRDDDAELRRRFAPFAKSLADNEQTIVAELIAVQGEPTDVGGYYMPDDELAARPCARAQRSTPSLTRCRRSQGLYFIARSIICP